MKQHRFIGNFDLAQARLELSDRALAHQAARVLKLQEGEEIILGNGAGKEAIALLERVSERSLSLRIISVFANENEPLAKITLYASILKHELFELVAQKATEIGVGAIVPIIAARTVKRTLRLIRLRQIVKEAAEQSGRGIIPTIAEPLKFEQALASSAAQEQNFFFNIGSPEVSWRNQRAFKTVGVFVGPEGGWEKQELMRARAAGLTIIGLGPLTLRAETAAIIASYVITRAARGTAKCRSEDKLDGE